MEVSLAEKLPVPPTGDLLGYLSPGGAFVGIVYACEGWTIHAKLGFHTPLHSAANVIGLNRLSDAETWASHVVLVLVVGLSAYMVGHILDSIAKLLIDRVLIYKGYGYPYQDLFGFHTSSQSDEIKRIKRGVLSSNNHRLELFDAEKSLQLIRDTPKWADFSKSFYRGIFFWLNLYLVVRWASLLSATNGVHVTSRMLLWSGRGLGIWFAVLVFGKLLLGQTLRNRLWATHHEPSLGPDFSRRCRNFKICRGLANGGYDFFSIILGKVLQTHRSFTSEFRQKYHSLFVKCFSFDPEFAESNNYWLPYLYVMSRSPEATALLSRYRQLFVFSRNLGVSLWVASIYLLVWYQSNVGVGAPSDPRATQVLLWQFPVLVLLSGILLTHFYYLYVCYYSKFLFRSFVFFAEREYSIPSNASIQLASGLFSQKGR